MLRRLLTASAGIAIWAVAFCCAHADIYAWVDSKGKLTLSDQRPPPGGRILEVVRENRAEIPAGTKSAATRETDYAAELRALSDRVRQLERQLESASARPAPPVVQYVPAPPPPGPGYNPGWADWGPW